MFTIENSEDHPSLISPKLLIRTIGTLGVSLPLILIIGTWVFGECTDIQNSISAYYHTSLGSIFVGVLWAMALCFWAYVGYHPLDRKFGIVVAVCAIGVSVFPTSVGAPFTDCITQEVRTGLYGRLHLVFAAVQFLGLAFFSLFLFTQSKKGEEMTQGKKMRNRIYRVCGYAIILFIVLIAVYWLFFDKASYPVLASYKPVFWLESLCLWAFGLAWFTKSGLFTSSPTSVEN